MRIFLAIPSLGPGGSERVLSILADHWASRGHDVTVATFEGPEEDFFVLSPEIRRVVLGTSAGLGGGWARANRRRVWAFRHAVREAQPDVVLSFLYTMNLFALLATRGLAPVVVAERTDPRSFAIGPLQAGLRRVLYPLSAGVVVQTRAVLEGWARRVARRSRIFAVPNPVLAPTGAEWRSAPLPGRFVASIGRLESEKGFDVLIDAFARVAPQHPEWSLVILGEGDARADLHAQAERLKIGSRVVMPGVGDAGALLARAELYASASRLEGFPNALLEAMANGLPVVVTDCRSGPAEIVRVGIDGYLVPVDDAAALAGALDGLLGDPRRRGELGSNARDVLERFGLERVAALWEDVFASARR